MFRNTSLTLIAALLLAATACSDDTEAQDGGATPGKDSGTDAPLADKGGADGKTQDGKAPDQKVTPDQQVTPDQKVTPDQHLTPDAAPPAKVDLKPFTLDSGFKALYRFADPAAKGATAMALSVDTLYLYQWGGATADSTVSMAAIDPKTGKPGTLAPVFSFKPTLTGTLFAGGFLALSPKGFAAAGYTKSGTFEGEIYWGDKGIKTAKQVAKAKGNYDAIFLDDKTMLINGAGVGTAQDGQGVYYYEEGKTPRRLIKDLGSASGQMALGNGVVFAGGFFTTQTKIYGFSLAEIKAAVSGSKTLSAATDGDQVFAGNLSAAGALGNDLVLIQLDASWKFKAVSQLPVTLAGDKVTVGTAKDIVSGGGTASIGKLAYSGKRLGLYITDGTKKEIAVIEKK